VRWLFAQWWIDLKVEATTIAVSSGFTKGGNAGWRQSVVGVRQFYLQMKYPTFYPTLIPGRQWIA
jgi:hypothetical protein